MRNIKPSLIIHIFALLHAVTALSCRLAGVEDELLLTIMTIAMSLLICYRKNLSIEFTASIIIVGNIIGYLMGTLGANLLQLLFSSQYVVNTVSTAVTTEVLGWSIVAFSDMFKEGSAGKEGNSLSSPYMKWLLLAAGGIFVIRLGIVLLFNTEPFDSGHIMEVTGRILTNSVSMVILICINILYIRLTSKKRIKDVQPWLKTLIFIGFMLTATMLESILAGSGIPFDFRAVFGREFPLLFTVSLLAQVTIYCIIYMANYAITAKSEMTHAREKANMAQYRYIKLKRQVNPHFLFNSLNILDCLVCEEQSEKASIYIHKLAGIYRYMIKSEDEELVPLRDELVFVNLYADLLKVRFPEGFDVEMNIAEEYYSRFVLPCSIQLLIENATKHNAVSADNPLRIKIESAGDGYIRVSNNIVPKITKSPSTGLGQKYIRQMYMDLSGKSIEIKSTADKYCVTLPLL